MMHKLVVQGLVGAVLLLTLLVGGSALATTSRASLTASSGTGKFDVGGYGLYLNCSGSGNPTVILESGRNQTWHSWSAVQPTLAKTRRVCSYDQAGQGQSDPGPSARSSQSDAEALHTLLARAGIMPPYVLAGYGLGALNVRLYAAQFPKEVAGLVLIDPFPEYFEVRALAVLQPEQRAEFRRELHEDDPAGFDFAASARQLAAAGPLPAKPLAVLIPTTGYPCDEAWPCAAIDQARQSLQSGLAALVPGGTVRIVDSGHFIQQDQPSIVISTIETVVKAARR